MTLPFFRKKTFDVDQIPIDERVLKMKANLKLSSEEISIFYDTFKKLDVFDDGTITQDVFFLDFLKLEQRNVFADSIFLLIRQPHKTEKESEQGDDSHKQEDDSNAVTHNDNELINFGEFVEAICTYCMFQIDEMIKFIFWQYDKEKTGFLEPQEVEFFVETVHSNDSGMKSNVATALRKGLGITTAFSPIEEIDACGNGTKIESTFLGKKKRKEEKENINFQAFKSFCLHYPGILFPCFQMQHRMRINMLLGGSSSASEKWWLNKIKSRSRAHLEAKYERERRKEERRLLRQRKKIIMTQMGSFSSCCCCGGSGFFAYYTNSSKRQLYEQIHPKPIVYLEYSGENLKISDVFVRVKYPEQEADDRPVAV